MMYRQSSGCLFWIIYVMVPLRMSEGNSCSDCMATIDGPYSEDTMRAHRVYLLTVNELEMAEYYCKFTCHNSRHNNEYILRTDIDVLSKENPHRKLSSLNENITFILKESDYNFSITNIKISSCNETSSVTIYKIQIIFLSVDSDTPTLVARCFVEYRGILATGCTSRSCSSPSTFAIIPKPLPTTSTTEQPSSPMARPEAGIPTEQIAPVTAILGVIVLPETILLSVCFLLWYKKIHDKTSVAAINHELDQDSKKDAKRTTPALQTSADSDSAVGTVSTLEII